MLKTKRGQKVWLITQPAHAELAGQMAAHWGNEEFAAPGTLLYRLTQNACGGK